jgi:hypothetical protein
MITDQKTPKVDAYIDELERLCYLVFPRSAMPQVSECISAIRIYIKDTESKQKPIEREGMSHDYSQN